MDNRVTVIVPGEPAAQHLVERILGDLDLDAVRVAEVHRLLDTTVRTHIGNAVLVQAVFQLFEVRRVGRDGDVLDPADSLLCLAQAKPGEVEEPEQVVVADVEEEVGRTGVVAVLETCRRRPLRLLSPRREVPAR